MIDKRRKARLAPTKGQQRQQREVELTNLAGITATYAEVVAIRKEAAKV
jgi:hypothetical protein